MIRSLAGFLRLPTRRKRIALEALAALLAARIRLSFRPEDLVRDVLEEEHPEGPSPELTHEVAWAISAVAGSLPGRWTCLTRALAAQRLLGRRGSRAEFHLGARRDDSNLMEAHAWLEVDGEPVVGDHPELGSYVELEDRTGTG